jgi:hypothetical protein
METVSAALIEPQARSVVYCGVCSMPPEYCEFGGTVKKCQEWLQSSHESLYERIWSAGSSPCAAPPL